VRLSLRPGGLVDLARLLFLAIAAILLIAFAAEGQGPPAVSIERVKPADTVSAPQKGAPLVFGFSAAVMQATGLPATAPMRSFCALARMKADTVFVDSIIDRAEPELPACRPEHVPIAIRPECKLNYAEHVLWTVARIRPAILFCGLPPEVYLFSRKPEQRAGQ
jgi:hypothetical protein